MVLTVFFERTLNRITNLVQRFRTHVIVGRRRRRESMDEENAVSLTKLVEVDKKNVLVDGFHS